MAAPVADFRPQLLGRQVVPRPLPEDQSGPKRLWQFFSTPGVQRSVLVKTNGDVIERLEFDTSEIMAADTYIFIPGGTDFRQPDDSWLVAALEAQGYTFGYGGDDLYMDQYTDEYPLAEGV